MPDDLQLLDPAQLREESEVRIDIGGGRYVMGRKLDMTSMLFEGLVPMPLLTAMQKMTEMRDATPAQRVAALSEDGQGRSMLELLRKHACAAVVKPKMVLEDTGDRSTLPVDRLHFGQLMAIWQATAIVPLMSPSAAATFRSQPSPVSVDAPHDGPDVQPATQPVDAAAVEVVHQ